MSYVINCPLLLTQFSITAAGEHLWHQTVDPVHLPGPALHLSLWQGEGSTAQPKPEESEDQGPVLETDLVPQRRLATCVSVLLALARCPFQNCFGGACGIFWASLMLLHPVSWEHEAITWETVR